MFSFSEAANLAVHSMALVAAVGSGARLSASTIARRLGRSESHTAKVLNRLSAQGLLESSRGAAGGFWLTADPSGISVRQVIEAIEGPLHRPQCLLGDPVCRQGSCVFAAPFGPLWDSLTQHLSDTKLTDFRIER